MTDRDESTGQFSSEEPAYGLAGIEKDAGYVPYQEEHTEETEDLTVAEAAERHQSRTEESDIVTHSPLDLPDNVSLTVEQAAKLKAESKAADDAQAELEEAERIRKEVDELRGVKPEGEAAKDGKTEATSEPGDPKADVEKFFAIPHVKEAVDKWNSETESVRETYSKATDLANDFARASFIENFPEIAGLPLEQWESALSAMAQREPDRFGKAVNSLQRVVQLQTAQQQEQQRRQMADRQRFEAYAKAENQRFETLVKGETKETMQAVEKIIPEMLAEYGADARQFLEAVSNNSTFPRATAERLLVDAAKYRMLKAAPKAVAARAPIPPVQRPGVAPSKGQRAEASLGELTGKLRQTGSVDDAYNLYVARKSSRGR